MGTQYDSSEDMAVDMLNKGTTREDIGGDINEITQEDVFEILKQMGAKIDALHAQFKVMKQDLQNGDRSITASRVLDTAIKTFEEVDAISDAATAFAETKNPMKKGTTREDIGGDIGDAEAEKMMDFLAEYNKNTIPEMKELLKMLKDTQEKNKEIKAIGTKTLEKMIDDLEQEIRYTENNPDNISRYNEN